MRSRGFTSSPFDQPCPAGTLPSPFAFAYLAYFAVGPPHHRSTPAMAPNPPPSTPARAEVGARAEAPLSRFQFRSPHREPAPARAETRFAVRSSETSILAP